MRTRIKFCGCTGVRDANAAIEMGVDAVGVIFAQGSPRCVSVETARAIARAVPAFVSLIGVFVDPTPAQIARALELGYVAQFSGNESAQDCETALTGPYIKVFHLPPAAAAEVDSAAFARFAHAYSRADWMFDTAVAGKHGGTGRTFDWDIVPALAGHRRVIVSGGLTAGNVGDCVRRLRPYGVDVRSGIETDGVKDPEKMRAFMRAVKEADAQT